MAKLTEKDLERYLVKECKKAGVLTYKFSSPAQRGVPDRILIGNGEVLFLELKRPGQVPTKLQLHHLQKIEEAGAWSAWCDCSASIDALIRRLAPK